MDKNEFRAVIKHFWMDGKTATEIRDILQKVHGTSTPSFSTISFWVSKFKRGRTSTKDEPRSGRPKTATNEEMVSKVHDLVLADRRVKLREIAETTGISYERVQNIVHEHLGMRKLSARWVPRLLTVDNKRNRVTTSKECLALLKRNPTDFFRRFVTVDETWIHHYTPETKQQSKQWTFPDESAPKKAKTVPSAGKVMATVFLGFARCDTHRLFADGKNYHGTILQRFIGSIQRHIEGETASFTAEKSALPPRQRAGPFIPNRQG